MNLQAVKDRPGLALIFGAMLVGTPRYVDAFANAAGFSVVAPVWDAFHAMSGFGMAILEALAIWYTAAMLSRYGRRDIPSGVLLGLMVATFASLAVIVTPTIMATAYRTLVVDLLDRPGMWIWSAALMLAPLLVIASSGIAEHLSTVRQTRPATSVRAPATTAQPVNVDVNVSTQVLQVGDNVESRLLTAARQHPGASQRELAAAIGVSRQTVNKVARQLKAAHRWPESVSS